MTVFIEPHKMIVEPVKSVKSVKSRSVSVSPDELTGEQTDRIELTEPRLLK